MPPERWSPEEQRADEARRRASDDFCREEGSRAEWTAEAKRRSDENLRDNNRYIWDAIQRVERDLKRRY